MHIGEKIRNAKIERDIQEPSLDQLRQICKILHLSADSLLFLNEEIISEKDLKLLSSMKILINEYTGRK